MAHVLVIDDEEAVRVLLERIIAHLGHEVIGACDGASALEAARNHTFDLVISDFHMPGAPAGLELYAALRKLQPQCPLVVSTGTADDRCLEDVRKFGVQHILHKPFEMEELRHLLATLFPG